MEKTFMMIYSIRLSKRKKESDFETFMLDEVFPAVDKGSRRDGQVTGLVLLKGHNTGHTNEYLWLVHGGLGGGAARQQVDKIVAFGARVTPMHEYIELGSWFADSEGPDK
jgi:hypothetical protein